MIACCRRRVDLSMAGCGRHILLKDVQGFKADGTVKAVIKKITGGDQYSTVNILRGELVEEYAMPELNFNMRLCHDPTICMYLSHDSLALAPLSAEEFLLLEGIEQASDRFSSFSNGGIELGMNLVPGSKVYVEVYGAGHVKKPARATVQFKGMVEGQPGTMFGVEILESEGGIGGSDGTFQGKPYFRCANGFGMFVPLNRLTRHSECKLLTRSSQEELREVATFARDNVGGMEDTPSSNTRLKYKMKESPVDKHSIFQVGDRVCFYDKKGINKKGTVKWIGNSSKTRNFGYNIIGIYTDELVFHTDYEKSVPGLGHLLGTPKNQGLCLPEAFVDEIEGETPRFEESITTAIAKEEKKSKKEFLHEQNRLFGEVEEAKPKMSDKQLAETIEGFGENIEEQLERFHKIEEEHAEKRRQQMLERQGSEKFKPGRLYDTVDDEHRTFKQEGRGLDLHGHDKTDIYAQNYPKSQAPSGSQTHRESEEHAMLASSGNGPTYNFYVNSMVQIPSSDEGTPFRYGIIRWIGDIPRTAGKVAGIELDESMDGCSDGSWTAQDGYVHQFFKCSRGKGLFYPLNRLQHDSKYSSGSTLNKNPLSNVNEAVPVNVSVAVNTDVMHYVGEKKGIQGHQNSCYLDATVFGLFALSEEFDEMFLRDRDSRVGQILWQKIVNPLRKYGVVKYESVMELRKELSQLGKMSGITSDEKDPEEFLNLMFKNSLKVDPFISIRRPFGIEPEYFVQLFLELSDTGKPAQIGLLLNKMFKEQSISFTQVPSKLLIQVPRHGKKYQSFQKIIPDIQLDISEVTDSVYTGECFFCEEQKAKSICEDCYKQFGSQTVMAYCDDCYSKSHKRTRKDHQKRPCEGGDSKLDLLSVLCIETSHYVCFTRHESYWLFFDSMSNRVYDQYNIPKVDDCTKELNEWVYPPDNNTDRLVQTPARDLPECVRRFTQDIYLCVYVHQGWGLY